MKLTKDDTKELLIVGGLVLACTALGFLAGLASGRKKKKQMAVTEQGKLIQQETE